VAVSVPSRTKGNPRYNFQLRSVPTNSDCAHNYAIANSFNTTISIPAGDWAFGFGKEQRGGSEKVYIFAPEIAAYFKFMMRPGNEVSRIMSPFALPGEGTIEFYKTILSKVLVHEESLRGKTKLRKLNKGEQEILLWSLTYEFGYESTLNKGENETPMHGIDWSISGTEKILKKTL
jgi:hypothetical protein